MRSKLDAEGQKKVLNVLAVGGTVKVAAELAGCTERAVYYAASRDPEFRRKMYEHKNQTEVLCLAAINDGIRSSNNRGNLALKALKILRPERYNCPVNAIPISKTRAIFKELCLGLSTVVKDEKTFLDISNFMKKTISGIDHTKARPWEEPVDEYAPELCGDQSEPQASDG